ncbi:hypothetical protein ABIB35_002572 [Arthrobacter sp. UYP6]
MRQVKQLGGSVLFVMSLAAALTACTPTGDLAFSNEGPDEVRVSTGNQDFTVDPDGGVQILGYGCTEGDIRVEFASGQEVVITEQVCPDQQIVIQDGTVDLEPTPAT